MYSTLPNLSTTAAPVPFLRYVGGKRQLVPELLKHIPAKYGRYHEPFVGGGALFFALRPARAFLSDSNQELITTWHTLQTDLPLVLNLLRQHAELHSEEHYYTVRAAQLTQRHAIAARMIYLNKTCFNGLYRVNKSGGFNVPIGKFKTPPVICDAGNLMAVAKSLTSSVFVGCQDFRQATLSVKSGDLVYFDPPYAPVSKTSDFTGYTPGKFTDADQRDLRDAALDLKLRGATVILSNSSAPIIDELYDNADFKIHHVAAKRSINSKTDRRGAVLEYIIT